MRPACLFALALVIPGLALRSPALSLLALCLSLGGIGLRPDWARLRRSTTWFVAGLVTGLVLYLPSRSRPAGPLGEESGVRLVGRVTSLAEPIRDGVRWQQTCGQGQRGLCLVTYCAQESPVPLPGDVVSLMGRVQPLPRPLNPEEFDYGEHLAARGLVGVVSARHLRTVATCPTPWESLLRPVARLRRKVRQVLVDAAGEGPEGAVMRALVLGDRAALPPAVRDRFARAGVAHLVAVSGLHLACVSGLVLLLMVRIRWHPHLGRQVDVATVFAWLTAIGFALLTALSTSCIRAAIMISGLAWARLIGRNYDTWSWLAVSAVVMLCWQPGLLYEAGFQLSTLSVAAIVLVLGHRPERKPRRAWQEVRPPLRQAGRYLLQTLRATGAAFLATLPATWYHFGTVALLAPLANLPAVPIVSLWVLPTSLAAAFLSLVWPSPGTLLIRINKEVLWSLDGALAAVADWSPRWSVIWPGAAAVALLSLTLLVLVAGRPFRRRVTAPAALVALGLVCLGGFASGPDEVRFLFLHVGNGDACLVETSAGVALVDGGPAGAGRKVIFPFLQRNGTRRLERVYLSHGHEDHFAGLLDDGPILQLCTITFNGTPAGERAARKVAARHAGCDGKPPKLVRSRKSTVDMWGGMRWTVLPPELAGDRGEAAPSENDASLLLVVETPAGRVIYAGDLERKKAARRLWKKRTGETVRQRAEAGTRQPGTEWKGGSETLVLKAPHHGAASPALTALVRRLRPSVLLYPAQARRPWYQGALLASRGQTPGPLHWCTGRDGALLLRCRGAHCVFQGFPW